LLAAKHHCVIPAPHHRIRAAWHLSDGHQMAWRDPFLSRGGELRGVPDKTICPLARTWQSSSSTLSTMPQRSRGAVKEPLAEGVTHRACLPNEQ